MQVPILNYAQEQTNRRMSTDNPLSGDYIPSVIEHIQRQHDFQAFLSQKPQEPNPHWWHLNKSEDSNNVKSRLSSDYALGTTNPLSAQYAEMDDRHPMVPVIPGELTWL